MLHDPHGDPLGISTAELACMLMSRLDAPQVLFSLLALMIELADEMPIDRQYRIAGSLRDAADTIEQKPHARELAILLEGPRS
jgi:hypothetical protein